ncbi:MAG: PQQ-binding-like beta-propeller repeat protein [Planctomycetes bacterium]|nr:PQQ-binding-like beta-propeller repeat protein [Planctomycetota bacterium]
MNRTVLLLSFGLLATGCLGTNRASPRGPQAIQYTDTGRLGERPQIDTEQVEAFGFQLYWDSLIRDEVLTSVSIEGDQLYAFTRTNRLYQIDIHSGMVNWVFDVDLPLSFTKGGHPIAEWTYEVRKGQKYREYDEIFFVAKDFLFGLDKKNGSEIFQARLNFAPSTPPRASSTHVFIGSWDDRIYAIRKDKPTLPNWSWRTRSDVLVKPEYRSPTVFVASTDGTLYTFDAATGRKHWPFKTGKPLRAAPLIYRSLLYLPSDDFNMYVLDPTDGLVHHRTCVSEAITSDPVGIGKTVYFGTKTGMNALLRLGPMKENKRKMDHKLAWTRKGAHQILCVGSQDAYLLEGNDTEGRSVSRVNLKDGHYRDSLPLTGVDFWVTNPFSPSHSERSHSLRGGIMILGFRNGWIFALKETATIPGA